MRPTYITLGLLCLSEQVSFAASKVVLRSPSHDMLYHEVASKVRRKADAVLDQADFSKRVAEPEPIPFAQAPSASPDITLDIRQASALTPNNNDTQTLCGNKLKASGSNSTSPSGMAVCYNVAAFDNSTGDFQAHVLIYMMEPGTGKWADINSSTESVELAYPGANKPTFISKQAPSQSSTPKLMQDLTFTSKVMKNLMPQLTNMTIMRMALTPNVTLTAMTTSGETIATALDNQKAAFVNGFLTDAMIAAASPTSTPFVLPGVTLGIFPIGLIVTSAWAALFLLAVGAGTIGRIRFRTSYRRRTAGGHFGASSMSGKISAAYDKART